MATLIWINPYMFQVSTGGGGGGGGGLYTFSSFSFNTANFRGRTGPTLTDFQTPAAANAYSFNADFSTYGYYTQVKDQSWFSQYWSLFNSTPGMQLWTVPLTGTYTVIAAGAPGGLWASALNRNGGMGAILTGPFNFTQGQQLIIQIGQTGGIHNSPTMPPQFTVPGRGGGGYTSIVNAANTSVPILVAAGGGGCGWTNSPGPGRSAFYLVTSTSTASARGTDPQGGTNAAGAGWAQASLSSTPANTWALGASGGTNGVTDDFGGFGGGGPGGSNVGVSNKGGGGGGWIGGNVSPNASWGGLGGISFCANANVALSPLWGSYAPAPGTLDQRSFLGGMCFIRYVVPRNTKFTITFTNCGGTGLTAPTWAQVQNAYAGIADITDYLLPFPFGFKLGYQAWIVPNTGQYTITAAGASGGPAGAVSGGRGKIIRATYTLNIGEVLIITVGHAGVDSGTSAGGGGGLTSVHRNGLNNLSNAENNINLLLLCAGGGGGAASTTPGGDATAIVTATTNPVSATGSGGFNGGAGIYVCNGRNGSWNCAIDSIVATIASTTAYGHGLLGGAGGSGWGGSGRTNPGLGAGGGGFIGGTGSATSGAQTTGGTSFSANSTFTDVGFNAFNASGYVTITQL